MNLPTYFSQQRGRKAALAKAIGVHAPDIRRWLVGDRPIPKKYGAAIERATDGQVTRQELFPSDWQDFWPELARPLDWPSHGKDEQPLSCTVTQDDD